MLKLIEEVKKLKDELQKTKIAPAPAPAAPVPNKEKK